MSTSNSAAAGRRRGYLAAFGAAAVLAWTAILVRHLSVRHGLPPLVLAFWRNALVVATLLPALLLLSPRRLRLARRDWPFLMGYGLVLACFNALWTFSVARSGASLATVLVYTSAAMTALLGAWLFGERLGFVEVLAIAGCLVGTALVSGWPGLPGGSSGAGWGVDPLGLVLGLLSGLAYAVYSLLGHAAARRGLDPWLTVLCAFGFGAGFLLAGHLGAAWWSTGRPDASGLFMLGGDLAGWGALLLLAAGPTVVGFGLYGVSLAHLPAGAANLVLTLEPVLTAFIAWALLGERLTGAAWWGSACILLAVALLRLRAWGGEQDQEEGVSDLPGTG